jgi:hypothetical protein
MATDHKAEIVSMSMGGWPSEAMRNATDYAYTNGVAVFAAAGNYMAIPFFPLTTPSFTVYPAAWRSCVGVAGITADDRSYSVVPSLWGWICDFSHWKQRGCSGPAAVMTRALCSYTPNVPWAVAQSGSGVALDGAGTSAATPQAAGAASLWLERYRSEVDRLTNGAPWSKAELTIQAMLRSATPPGPGYSKSKFGVGSLNAAAALGQAPQASWLPDKPQVSRKSLNWILLLASIAYHHVDDGVLRLANGQPAVFVQSRKIDRAVDMVFSLDKTVSLLGANASELELRPAFLNTLNTEVQSHLVAMKHWEKLAQINESDEEGQAATALIEPSEARAILNKLDSSESSRYLRKVIKEIRQQNRLP